MWTTSLTARAELTTRGALAAKVEPDLAAKVEPEPAAKVEPELAARTELAAIRPASRLAWTSATSSR